MSATSLHPRVLRLCSAVRGLDGMARVPLQQPAVLRRLMEVHHAGDAVALYIGYAAAVAAAAAVQHGWRWCGRLIFTSVMVGGWMI
eukprot:7713-Eustigmatos_ZCMA.PRE.1